MSDDAEPNSSAVAGWPDPDDGVAQAPVAALPPPEAPAAGRGHRPQVGQLTTAWQIMVAAAWGAAFFAFAGVWKASEEVGIATWWLGPRADPQPIVLRIAPFVLIAAVALCAVYNLRIASWLSLGGSAALGVIAAIDLSHMIGLALAEFAIAGALLLVSVASLGGRYRPGPEPPTAPAGG